METKKRHTEDLKKAILQSIFQRSSVDSAKLAKRFLVSPQSIYKQMHQMEKNEIIKKVFTHKRQNYYILQNKTVLSEHYSTDGLNEDTILNKLRATVLSDLKEPALRAFSYVFTEMLNNAIDHSESPTVFVEVYQNAYAIGCRIVDQGIGIFEKIQKSMGLEEKRFAVLELAKGKFTTDPASHTGEGIFFSSKIADYFTIVSDDLCFLGSYGVDEEVIPVMMSAFTARPDKGSSVTFEIILTRTTTPNDVFRKYTEHPDHYGFTKTMVPVSLLEYGEDNPIFVSRSQAKRLLNRFDRFKNIVLDFEGVSEIGQGFADEIFRVFVSNHPECTITFINANKKVKGMISHVTGTPIS